MSILTEFLEKLGIIRHPAADATQHVPNATDSSATQDTTASTTDTKPTVSSDSDSHQA